MTELVTIYGIPITDVPEPLRSALQERLPSMMAWMRDCTRDPLLPYDEALLARFFAWRTTRRLSGHKP